MIIGKKGETLKDLRVKSGAQIVMSADTLPKSDERTCRLTGSNFAVVAAVDLIVEIMIKAAIQEGNGEWKGTPSNQITPYDPKNESKDGKQRDEKVYKWTGQKKEVQFGTKKNHPYNAENACKIHINGQARRIKAVHLCVGIYTFCVSGQVKLDRPIFFCVPITGQASVFQLKLFCTFIKRL